MSATWGGINTRRESRTTSTGIISDLWLDDDMGTEDFVGVQVSADSLVDVAFTITFASLIRDGLYQILDGDLMARLGSSPSRALYRALAAHRIRGDHLAQVMRVNLREWTVACGLSERTDAALGTLEASHERLINEGYLEVVEDEGRGAARSLTYRFRAASHPEQVRELTLRGVVPAVAASVSADHPERIMPAIQAVEHRVQGGWKPRSLSAAIVDAIKNPQKWEYAPQEPLPSPRKERAPRPAPAQETAADPRGAVAVMLKLKLKRDPSPLAQEALATLSPEGVAALVAAVKRPGPEALELAVGILGTPL
ncbi:plasmid replication initiator protein [Deinococcus aestuarii]|uniref:plasmid replication initiator protein n=1 Tax=Deinococcus aestuarii TaxID=2774531 RepID=UPI001C0BD9A8|nr:plasmid replication initiator protein [Deinococcus aestuarii]